MLACWPHYMLGYPFSRQPYSLVPCASLIPGRKSGKPLFEIDGLQKEAALELDHEFTPSPVTGIAVFI